VEPVWLPLNASWDEGVDAFLCRFRAVRPEVGNLYAAHWCQSEVCNGGFRQFFSNTTGILAPEALKAFEAIGLTEWTSILGEATGCFGRRYPRERDERIDQMPARIAAQAREGQDPFERLNERFFAWLHTEPDRWERAADGYAAQIQL
jgi:hypothetical protein